MSSPLVDQADREQAARDLDTTLLVEAAAGTGKTTVTTDRILHILRSGRATMEQIVAITFTEKAASELKIRLRERIETARPQARGDEQARLERAARELERGHIHTIHGFCSWLLKERPIAARVDPSFTVLDALQTELVLEESWEEWFRQQMENPPEVLRRALFAELDLARLRQLAFELIQVRDRLDLAALRPSSHTVADGVAELRAVLAPLRPKLAHCLDPSDDAYQQIERLLQSAAALDSLPPWRQEYELIHNLRVRKTAGSQKNWADKDSLGAIKKAYERILAIPARRKAALLRDLLAWLAGFVTAFEQHKRRQGALDFDDLLIHTRNLLRDNLAQREFFQRRFAFVLVDEFQDTDPTQTEIVFWLAEDGARAARWQEARLRPGKLFLVGDPKQSIYRFRRADIETYEAAKQLIQTQGRVLTIHQSFRTASGLCAWVDDVFGQLIRPPEDGERYQPHYVPLHPSRQTHGPRVCVLEPTQEQTAQIAAGNIELLRSLEAREVARLIEHLVRSAEWSVQNREDPSPRPPRYCDFAILLHSPAVSLAAYEKALQQQGIPYQVEGGKDYFQSQEVRAVAALLLALDDPMNTRELVGVLRSAVFGFSDDQIFLWSQQHPLCYLSEAPADPGSVGEALALLRRLHEQRNTRSLPALLELLYSELKLPELFSLKPHGEQRVANLQKLLGVARRLQQAGLLSLREFVDYLRTTALERSEEGQSAAAEGEDDVVSLLSIHKAKGLEWNIVIVGDLGAQTRSHRPRLLVDAATGAVAIHLGSQWETEDYPAAWEKEKRRQNAEELRLLYVAATRARDHLILPWFASKGNYLNHLKRAFDPAHAGRATAAFHRRTGQQSSRAGSPSAEPIRVRLDAPSVPEQARVEQLLAQRVEWIATHQQRLAVLNQGRLCLSPSRLADEERSETRVEPPTAESERARLFGAAMHETLARLDFAHADAAAGLWKQVAGAAGQLGEEDIRRGEQMLERFRQTELFGRIAWAREVYREVPFSQPTENGLVEGVMDLVFREADGWVLVDYKTDRLEADQVGEAVELYRPQLAAYGAALESLVGIRPAKILMMLHPGREVRLG